MNNEYLTVEMMDNILHWLVQDRDNIHCDLRMMKLSPICTNTRNGDILKELEPISLAFWTKVSDRIGHGTIGANGTNEEHPATIQW